MHGEMRGERRLLHGREGDFVTAAARAIGLSDDGKDFEIRFCEETLQRGNGKLRRATETDSQWRRLPLALFPELLDFALDEVALEHAQMLQKEDAIEVIDFMAEGAGKHVFTADFKRLAFDVLGFHGDKLRADDVTAEAGNREAAFFLADFTLGVSDFGISQDNFRFRVFPAGHVHDSEA